MMSELSEEHIITVTIIWQQKMLCGDVESQEIKQSKR
jgi:hypothetical protein